MRNWTLTIAICACALLLALLMSISVCGTQELRTWLKDYGGVLSAALAAAVTAVYVVLTHQHLKLVQQMYRFQFGAGIRMELVQEDRDLPPTFRILDAYNYPETYVRAALPHRLATDLELDDRVQSSLRYEIVRIYNERDNPIYELSLSLALDHGSEKRVFAYKHPEFIGGKQMVEIGVWPVDNMPNYTLTVNGSYGDAVGTFRLQSAEVTRDEQDA
jgi:hypothetical protein